MNRARRAFAGLVSLTALAFATANAQDAPAVQDEPFPRPAALEPAVQFWTRVYTEITTREGFIHDDTRLDVVYQTVKVGDDLSTRERRRRVERAVDQYQAILTKLAGGARTNLSGEEERVLHLFPEGTSSTELRAAASRVRFQLGQADRFRAGLIRSGTWKQYIYDVLDKQGLPRELAALPHVESSFDPTAYSKVGAAGMWQFMRSTGVRYMRIDHVVDERRDPFLASEAAARVLADNYDVLQSWPLAVTAYNHGVGGMRNATVQQKTKDIATIVAKYQSRSFGFASRNFYTAFLAAVQIDRNPTKYFGSININPPSDTGVVVVPDFLSADALADALNLREGKLRELNPALSDAVWSGDKLVPKGFSLRVPKATAAVAEELMAAIHADQRFASQRQDLQHKVRRGDTLSTIAAEYHVSLAALMRINGLGARDMIRVGQLINLPVDARGGAAPAAVLARAEAPAPAAPVAATTAPVAADGTYVVRSGDSLDRIAKRLGTTVDALIAANTLGNKNVIFPGQTLQLPGTATAPSAVLASNTEAPSAAAGALATAPGRPAAIPAVAVTAAEADERDEVATDELAAALQPAVLANGEPSPVDDGGASDVNALATEQADLAADPSNYSVNASNQIEVQALETLGHYADWLEIPTQRLRDINKISFKEAVVIGQMLTLDFSKIDQMTFEQRRVAYQQQEQGEFFMTYQIAEVENRKIKPGESLWVLAARTYKVPVWLLRQYNPDLNLDRVSAGIVVKFPRLKKFETGQDAAAPAVADIGPGAEANN
ncbi:MAG TPA: LysM peptidoglycan-binding domain-containing protein [Gammaproteobacteria bacterium]|nr:LysM peptidoglycan-binding domain-containing protein [Gammaproteobacteria bacterium]